MTIGQDKISSQYFENCTWHASQENLGFPALLGFSSLAPPRGTALFSKLSLAARKGVRKEIRWLKAEETICSFLKKKR
jgi:hypothetical protein